MYAERMNSKAARLGQMSEAVAMLMALLLVVLLGACAPASTSAGSSAQVETLAAYNTVVIFPIIGDNGVRDQYGLEHLLAQELQAAGFKVVLAGEMQRSDFDRFRALQLGVSYYWTGAIYGSFATVDLVLWDGLGTEIFRTQGTHAGVSLAADAQGAARKAVRNIASAYPGFNSGAISHLERQVDKWPLGLATTAEVRDKLSAGSRSLDPIEGIWASEDGSFSIGIYPAPSQSGVDFVGTLVTGAQQSWIWRSGMVRLEVTKTAAPGRYTIHYWNDWLDGVGRTIELRDGVMVITDVPGDGSESPSDQVMVKSYPVQSAGPRTSDPAQSEQRSVSGSGFLISETGLIVTNAHVVEGTSAITVHLAEGTATFKARVLLNDMNNDLAVLQLVGFDFADVFAAPIPYALGDSNTTIVGQDVLALGFPLSTLLGSSVRVTNGIISARTGIQDAPNVFQISNPVQPGNSGGPLLNMYGDVVGIVVSSLDAGFVLGAVGALPQNVNFAVKSSYLRNLIGMLPAGADVLSREPRTEAMTGGNLVTEATPFIALIQAE